MQRIFDIIYKVLYLKHILVKKKSRIEIITNFIAYVNVYKTAKFKAYNQYNATFDIIGNSNDKKSNDYANIDLAKFEINIKILLSNCVKKIRYR